MAKKFSISNSMLNDISKNTKKSQELEAKEKDNIQYIDIDNIEPSSKNFYEIKGIDELATDIKLNGLNHNLVVRSIGNDKFEIISGERRYTALKKLVSEGENDFKYVRCLVKDNLNDVDSEIILIQANAQTRELSEYEKIKQVERLNELYKEKKSKGEPVGKIRERISKDLNISEAQVQRLSSANQVIPELLRLVKDEKIGTSTVSLFSTLTTESQEKIVEIIKAATSKNNENMLTRDEAEKMKKEFKKIENEKEELKKKIKDTDNEKIQKLKKEIEQQYLKEIESLKAEKIKEINEKEELKKKIKEVDKNNLELKNNIIVNTKIKEIKTSVSSLYSIIEEMKKNNHNLDEKEFIMIDELIESLEFIKDMK